VLDRTTHVECLRLLLTRCDPKVRSRFGQMPLHEVAALGDWITDEEVVAFATLLVGAGATLTSGPSNAIPNVADGQGTATSPTFGISCPATRFA
jgi:hypothetical protein